MTIQAFDESLLLTLNSLLGQSSILDQLIEAIAVYTIYVIPLGLTFLWFLNIRESGLRAALAGILTWLVVSPLIALVYFRPRPSLAELGGQELLFHRPSHSFPSDHAGFLAALTVTFYLNGYRKLAIALFVLTLVVSLARVSVGFHFPTDIMGGWVIGSLVAWFVHYIQKPIDKHLSQPLIKLASMIRLA